MNPFIGMIVMFGGNFAPRGWAFCDGQLLAINNYQALFSILGTTYGGDGRTTFGLPDLRGRIPMHPGNGPGLSNRSLGQKAGAESETLTQNQLPAHTHPVEIAVSNSAGEEGAAAGNVIANHAGAFNEDATTGQFMGAGSTTTSSGGGGLPHNNVQPYQCVNFIIALVGVFPSRS